MIIAVATNISKWEVLWSENITSHSFRISGILNSFLKSNKNHLGSHILLDTSPIHTYLIIDSTSKVRLINHKHLKKKCDENYCTDKILVVKPETKEPMSPSQKLDVFIQLFVKILDKICCWGQLRWYVEGEKSVSESRHQLHKTPECFCLILKKKMW